MIVQINARYLALPVSCHAVLKKICFQNAAGELVYDLDVRLDPQNAQFVYYADMRSFKGQTLNISCMPKVEFTPEMTDKIPALSGEVFRPEVHFTPQRGWINDPNGLVLYEGKYHLFFQYNPVGMYWGNMHWGHAVSEDLIHWEEKEIALYPDHMGTMYSGSAIVDEKNLTGLQENEHAPLLLYYTAAGGSNLLSEGQPCTQCMAYSIDGGRTFRKYAGNPVVSEIVAGNRDPKVVFCPEIGKYVMALYLEGNTYALFQSENLLDWALMQKIDLAGDAECPDLYPLELGEETYWVLSGASDFYLIGKMTETGYVPIQQEKRLNPNGGTGYAAQTYSGLSDNRRVRISWNRFDLPGMPFNGSMSTPVDLFLQQDSIGIALCARPVGELKGLYGKRANGRGTIWLPGKANDIMIRIPADRGNVTINILGLSFEIRPEEGVVRSEKCDVAIRLQNGLYELRMIQDVHSLEIYSGDGAGYVCYGHLADKSLCYVEAPEFVQIEANELKNYRK